MAHDIVELPDGTVFCGLCGISAADPNWLEACESANE